MFCGRTPGVQRSCMDIQEGHTPSKFTSISEQRYSCLVYTPFDSAKTVHLYEQCRQKHVGNLYCTRGLLRSPHHRYARPGPTCGIWRCTSLPENHSVQNSHDFLRRNQVHFELHYFPRLRRKIRSHLRRDHDAQMLSLPRNLYCRPGSQTAVVVPLSK